MSSDYQKQINLAGEALLKAINGLIQTAKMHLDNNDLLVDAVAKFKRTMTECAGKKTRVAIQIVNERFYFQEEKLILRHANARLFNHMQRYLENRGIYGFHFQSDLSSVPEKQIPLFARLLDRSVRQENPVQWLAIQLEKHNLQWAAVDHSEHAQMDADVLTPAEISQPEELALKKKQVRKTYSHLLGSVKEVARKLTSNESAGIRNSVRIVQKMVDLITQDESLFLGISTIRIYDDYTYVHSLNVAILSMCLGKRIGLTHQALESLGLCGLFHDLGKVEVPKDILNKKGKLSKSEYAQLQNHSMHSARLILKMQADKNRKVKFLVPPFEHHMGYDHSGYPHTATRRKLSLFGRILTIADVYDAITSPRVYRPTAMSPDKALSQMMKQSGSLFDPILLKVFILMLGAFPVGTLLKFNTGEIGISMRPCADPDGNGTVVQLLDLDKQGQYSRGDVVEIRHKDPQADLLSRIPVRSMHPMEMGIQAAEFLLA